MAEPGLHAIYACRTTPPVTRLEELVMSVAVSIIDAKQNSQRWWVLAIVVAAQFMFVVDAFVVNVAIASIHAELHATIAETQGTIVIY